MDVDFNYVLNRELSIYIQKDISLLRKEHISYLLIGFKEEDGHGALVRDGGSSSERRYLHSVRMATSDFELWSIDWGCCWQWLLIAAVVAGGGQ